MPLIVLEGVDASGKATQTKKLCERLKKMGKDIKTITFPDYDSPSSEPVKMYLSGLLGKSADSVNAYAASALFAVDRFCSFKTGFGKDLEEGKIVVADRYVTSNFIHQASKISSLYEKDAYLDFQSDFEYNKIGLPKPDIVIFLDVPPELSLSLMKERENKFTHEKEHDIHECDADYIRRSYENALYVAEKFGFTKINCEENGKLKSIDSIADCIFDAVSKVIF